MLKALLDAVMERRARELLHHVDGWIPARARVLDLGSGTGHLSAQLERERGEEVVAADVTDIHVTGRPPVVIEDGALPFGDGTFAAVLLFFMLAYPADPPRVLAEAARVTHGPLVLVQTVYSGRLGYAWHRAREYFWAVVAFHVSRLVGYIPGDAAFTMHARRFYTADALQRDIAAAGLCVRERRERAVLSSVALAAGVARGQLRLPSTRFEVVVVDDGSEDATAAIVRRFADDAGVRLVACRGGTCAAARNAGVAATTGRVLCFIDADTVVPEHAVARVLELHEAQGRCLVLYRLASREPGIRAWLWWTFWGLARHLPLARAKSMPAFMSCDRAHFERYGPFEESRVITEEWPLTGAAYRHHPERFLYDVTVTARTSSRRMELQPFGYLRTALRWVSVVLFPWERGQAYDRIRHEPGSP